MLTQTVTIPAGGRLSYWWQMHTYETTIFHDNLQVDVVTLEGDVVASLAGHGINGPQDLWQQDAIDVSAHAGRTLVLRFHAYNDNYYFSWFDPEYQWTTSHFDLTEADACFSGPATHPYFPDMLGRQNNAAGDVNGDGYDDFLVSHWRYSPPTGYLSGTAYSENSIAPRGSQSAVRGESAGL
ncbi:MAG: hypothetical protein P8129_17105 [Anaerolineae bacterium]